MSDTPFISLASPVYNNSENIDSFIKQSVKALKEIDKDFEIVLVNDASTDDTRHKLSELEKQYEELKVINLKQNSGQHIATSIALSNTTGDYILMVDSDMQIDPALYKSLVDKGRESNDWDVISGSRSKRSNKLSRKIGSRTITYLINVLFKTNLKDVGSTFKLFKRESLENLLNQGFLIQNIPLLIAHMRYKQIEVEIEYNTKDAKSNYTFSTLIIALILAFLNFTSGNRSIIFLLFSGVICGITSLASIVTLIIQGIISQEKLPTNLLIFFLCIGMFSTMMIMLGIIAFKLERITKNLEFRKKFNEYSITKK